MIFWYVMLILISNDDFTDNDDCEFWRKCCLMVKGLNIYNKHTHIYEKNDDIQQRWFWWSWWFSSHTCQWNRKFKQPPTHRYQIFHIWIWFVLNVQINSFYGKWWLWWSRDLTFVNEDCPSVQMKINTSDYHVNRLVFIVDRVILISLRMKQYTSDSLTVRFIQNIKKCSLPNLYCSVCISWNIFKCVLIQHGKYPLI